MNKRSPQFDLKCAYVMLGEYQKEFNTITEKLFSSNLSEEAESYAFASAAILGDLRYIIAKWEEVDEELLKINWTEWKPRLEGDK